MKLAYQYIAIFFAFSTTSSHLHPLQVGNCDSNSRLVVDEDDNIKSGLKELNVILAVIIRIRSAVKWRQRLMQIIGAKPCETNSLIWISSKLPHVEKCKSYGSWGIIICGGYCFTELVNTFQLIDMKHVYIDIEHLYLKHTVMWTNVVLI